MSGEIVQDTEKFEGDPTIQDGGGTELNCEHCGRLLITILCSRPQLDFDATYKAKCYDGCPGFSESIYIKGGTHFIFPGDKTKRECFVENFTIIDGITILKMKKG